MDVRTNFPYIADDCRAGYNGVIDTSFASEATTLPFTLAEVKTWCKIDISDDDTLVTALITGARRQCEKYTGIGFVAKTVTAIINNINGYFELPYGPVTGSIVLTDIDAATISSPEIIGESFKKVKSPCLEYIKAVYAAGYTNLNLPGEMVTAWKMQVAWMYENRGDGDKGVMSPEAIMILDTIRRVV